MGTDRLANTLAALSGAIHDRVTEAIAKRSGLGLSDAAALVILARRARLAPNRRIEALRHDLRLSHSAAVRLIDRLELAGLARREPGLDGRSVAVNLTAAGKRAAESIQRERERVVDEALAPLDEEERKVLGTAVDRLLEALPVDWPTAMNICRLCDLPRCEAEEPCPVALGADAKSM